MAESITPLGFVNETGQLADVTPSGFINETSGGGAGATAVTLSGPTSGTVTVASGNFTVGVDATPITGTLRVTPASTKTGTFTPTYRDLTTASPTGTFTYTASADSGQTHVISCTNSGGLTNPANVTYVVAPAVSLILVAGPSDSTPRANLTGLKWAWFDVFSPAAFDAPVNQGSIETTDGSGVLFIPLPVSLLGTGDVGWLIVSDSDGTPGQDPPAKMFSGPVEVL